MQRALFLGAITAFASSAFGQAPFLQPIAVTGQAAPDGSIYQTIGAAHMGADGTIAFQSTFQGGGLGWNLLASRAGSMSILARVGQTAPGTNSAFTSVTGISMGRTGDIGFLGTLNASSGFDTGAWGNRAASGTRLVTLEGLSLPGSATLTGNIEWVLANSDRYAVAPASSTTSPNPAGVWAGSPGSPSTVARVGNLAPGWNDSGRFTELSRPSTLTASGLIAFGGIAKAQSATLGQRGLWAGPIGSPQLVARAQTPAPGGGTFAGVGGAAAMNDSGQIVFSASLDAGDLALFSGTTTSYSRLMRAGDSAPGTGTTFRTVDRPQINASGGICFYSTINRPVFANSYSTSFWRTTAAGLAPIAIQGEHAPGTSSGVVYSALDGLLFNDHGQNAFLGTLFGPGVNTTNSEGVWYTDWNDPSLVHLLARTGDLIEVSPGVMKTIRTIGIGASFGELEGGPANLSNSGQIALTLGFTDSTNGLFVATVPAPSTASVFLATAILLRRRRTSTGIGKQTSAGSSPRYA